jgi:hypothetical protein
MEITVSIRMKAQPTVVIADVADKLQDVVYSLNVNDYRIAVSADSGGQPPVVLGTEG